MRKKPNPAAMSATVPVIRVDDEEAPGCAAAADVADCEALGAAPVAAAAEEPAEPEAAPEDRAAERDSRALETALETLETAEPDAVAEAVEAAAPEAWSVVTE